VITAKTGKLQELFTRFKKEKFQNGLPAISEGTVQFFSYILYLSFLITAHVIKSHNKTITLNCYIRICNKKTFYFEFRFKTFSFILAKKVRWVQTAFQSRVLKKKIFRFEGNQVMEKFIISKQIVIIPSNTTTPLIYKKTWLCLTELQRLVFSTQTQRDVLCKIMISSLHNIIRTIQ
jgi:hypothetical protein